MAISAALKRIYASAPTDQRYIETLSFHHSRFSQDWYFTNDNREWTFRLETAVPVVFQPIGFTITMPTNDKRGNQDLTIGMSNIGRQMMNEIHAANQKPSEAIRCVLRIYLDIQNSDPQNTPVLDMSITDIDANLEVISATARRADILNRPFPSQIYTLEMFPGLNR